MTKYSLLLLFGCIFYLSHGQQAFNMTLLDHWDDPAVPGTYNDIWGYTHTDGSEYAIIGSSSFVHFLDLSDVQNVIEVLRHAPGNSTSWRDFKTMDTVAYGVCDQCSEGLSIYNMSYVPNSVVFVKSMKTDFVKAHNIFVDVSNKRLYVCGYSSSSAQGLITYDISDPFNPSFLSKTRYFSTRTRFRLHP